MQVEVIERAAVRIVYLRYTGPYGRPLAAFWTRRVTPWIAERRLGGRAMYAISLDNPNITAPESCRCDIGVEVDEVFGPEGNEQIQVVAGGRYATTRFFDTVDRLAATWRRLIGEWLPASGYVLDAMRPTFEYYPPEMRFEQGTGAFECDVLIPVKTP